MKETSSTNLQGLEEAKTATSNTSQHTLSETYDTVTSIVVTVSIPIESTTIHDGNEIDCNNDDLICTDFVAKTKLNHNNDDAAATTAAATTTTTTQCSNTTSNDRNCLRLICDLGYGLPVELRPRKEKILAIAKQLVNFLSWQQNNIHHHHHHHSVTAADIYIILGKTLPPSVSSSSTSTPTAADSSQYHQLNDTVAKCEATTTTVTDINDTTTTINDCTQEDTLHELKAIRDTLLARMCEVWNQQQNSAKNVVSTTDLFPFPEHCITFCYDSLNEFLQKCSNSTIATTTTKCDSHQERMVQDDTIYLSPDATDVLDITKRPPTNIIIGLLIDRRTIQQNRSVVRAQEHDIPAVRWPLENITGLPPMHKNEPLNVDCVLEGMQQWYWNIVQHTAVEPQPEQLSVTTGTTAPNVVNIMEISAKTITGNNSISPTISRKSFEMAVTQAIQHHIIRHPQRPLHLKKIPFQMKS